MRFHWWWWHFFPNRKHADWYPFGSFSVKPRLFELLQTPHLRESSRQSGNRSVLLLCTFDVGGVISFLEAVSF